MTVSAIWVSPVAAGSMDLTTGGVLTETWCDAVASDLLVLGGLDGHTMSAIVVTGGATVSSGNLGVGGAPAANIGVNLPNTLVMNTGLSQYGVASMGQGGSNATAEYSAFVAQATTVALSFTCAVVADYHALTPVKGSTSHIASAYGLLVDIMNAGETNNFGVYVSGPTGGSNLNVGVYVAGGGLTVAAGTTNVQALIVAGGIGFYGQTTPQARNTITGAKAGNAALSSLLGCLASYGLIVDSTSA